MKVLVDLTAITDRPSGARVRARELYARVAGREGVHLAAAVRKGSGLEEPLARAGAEVLPFPRGVSPLLRLSRWTHGPARRLCRSGGFHLFAAETLPVPAQVPVPVVVTVHDLRFFHPGLAPFGRRAYGRLFLGRNLRRSCKVIVPSEAVREEGATLFPYLGEKTCVVPNGVPPLADVSPAETRVLLRETGAASPYFLCLGHVEPRKNLPVLLEAFHRFRSAAPERRGITLVVAGDGDLRLPVRAWTRLNGRAGAAGLRVTGPVTEKARAVLLRNALAVVQPSRYEGFGLGLLEALAAGIPAAASEIPAHREVAGPSGACFFDPGAVEEAEEALVRVAFDFRLRERLVSEGRRRSETFSWDAAARLLLQAWRSVQGEEEDREEGA